MLPAWHFIFSTALVSSLSVRSLTICGVWKGSNSVFIQLSGAFSGLLTATIENLDGIRSKVGWAWIFILV
jgi:hypothetical protein